MRHLFIPASNTPRTLKHLLITLIALAITIILTDRLFSAVIPRITTEPPYITRFQNVNGIQSFWKFLDEGIKPVVFTGSSTLHVALSPHLFDEQVKKITGQSLSSVNMSFWSSIVVISRDVIEKFLLPSRVKVIV